MRTQKDANEGVNEVDKTRKGGEKDIQMVPGNSANDTPLSCLPTIHCCPTLPKPSTDSLEDFLANPTANKGVQKVRNEGEEI